MESEGYLALGGAEESQQQGAVKLDQNDKADEANDEVPAEDELSERLDDVSG